ncbi:DUF1761 domain-containing protein [Patescibacteria group bacterium]|nr:DUF1761 domain-containing protein [Patescibacteria group bacterium]
MTEVIINYWAVLVCGVASVILGFAWYGPLFGKKYMQLQGVTEADVEKYKKDKKMRNKMMRNYFLTFALALATAYAFANFLGFAEIVYGVSGMSCAFMVVSLSFLGFVLPATSNLVFFDKKNWEWWFLVNGYYLVQLLLIGTILTMWV